MDGMQHVTQHGKPLLAQFIAMHHFSFHQEFHRLYSTISNTKEQIIFQGSLVYTLVDGSCLICAAIHSQSRCEK
jgi:hypothetical protein